MVAAGIALWIHFGALADLSPERCAHTWECFVIQIFCAAGGQQIFRSALHGGEHTG